MLLSGSPSSGWVIWSSRGLRRRLRHRRSNSQSRLSASRRSRQLPARIRSSRRLRTRTRARLLGAFDYSFNTYDASGTLIASYPGESFAYPNEVKYLVLVNQAVASSVATFDLTVPTTTTSWIASSSYGALPQLAVESVSTQIGSSTIVAGGELLNNDTATFNNVFIIAIFKDASGNPIGASQTEVGSIAPGQAVPFSVIYPAVAAINPAATEVDAYAYRQ